MKNTAVCLPRYRNALIENARAAMVVAAIVVTSQENRLQEMCADMGLNVSPFHNPSPSIGRNPARQAVLWTVPLSDTERRIGFHVEHNKPHGEMQPPLQTGAGGHTHRLPIATQKNRSLLGQHHLHR